MLFLVSYTLVGDGNRVREVHTVAVQGDTPEEVIERINRWFGEGYLHICKVECVG